MSMMTFLYAFGVGIIFIAIGFFIGALRTFFITPKLGERISQVISAIFLICGIFIGAYLFLINLGIYLTREEFILLGIFWVILTHLLEVGIYYYSKNKTWFNLYNDFNMYKGGLRSIVLLAEFIAPLLFSLITKK